MLSHVLTLYFLNLFFFLFTLLKYRSRNSKVTRLLVQCWSTCHSGKTFKWVMFICHLIAIFGLQIATKYHDKMGIYIYTPLIIWFWKLLLWLKKFYYGVCY